MKSIFNFRFTLLMFFCLAMAMAKASGKAKTKAPTSSMVPSSSMSPTKSSKSGKASKSTTSSSTQTSSTAEVAPEEVGWGVGALGFGLLGLAYLTLRRKKTRRQESLESLEEHQDANLDDLQESNQPDDASLGHEVSPGQLQLEDPDSAGSSWLTKLTPSWWC